MPKVTSGRQYRFLQAVRAGRSTKEGGPTPEQANRMIHETPAKKRSAFARAKGKLRSKHRGY